METFCSALFLFASLILTQQPWHHGVHAKERKNKIAKTHCECGRAERGERVRLETLRQSRDVFRHYENTAKLGTHHFGLKGLGLVKMTHPWMRQ